MEVRCCWQKIALAWLLYADLTRRSCRAEEKHHRVVLIRTGLSLGSALRTQNF
jgi:hypothetical protein